MVNWIHAAAMVALCGILLWQLSLLDRLQATFDGANAQVSAVMRGPKP